MNPAEKIGTVRPLEIHGRTVAVKAVGRTVRIPAEAAPALREIDTLAIPETVKLFQGLNRFENLKEIRYDGEADIFGFQENLDWLTEKAGDDALFRNRMTTSMFAAPPVSGAMMAIVAPRMEPLHAMPNWTRLLELFDDIAARCVGYGTQDLRVSTLSYAQMKRFEYALYMGYAISPETYPERIARYYLPEARFTGEDRIYYALALLQGHSYREFNDVKGSHDYGYIKSKAAYLEYLRTLVVKEDTEPFRRALETMLELGVISETNYQTAVDMLLRGHLTQAAAFLLQYADRHPALRGQAGNHETVPDFGFLDEEFRL